MEKASVEYVSPGKAERWLVKNKSNRTLRSGLVEKYIADMKTGRWTQCLAPIAFYEDGDVADGQHRLWAVMKSDTTQQFYVVRGVSRAAGLNIDVGMPRNIVDNANIAGVAEGLTYTLVALCRAINQGDRASRDLTNAMKLDMVNHHRLAAEWTIAHGPAGRYLRNAITMGAIGRAWYHEDDKNRLQHFGAVLSKGFSNGDEDAAGIALRNYLQSHPSATSSGLWRDTFLKSQNALWYFMRRKRLFVIKTVEAEQYPLKRVKK